jgi:hypothetical protein
MYHPLHSLSTVTLCCESLENLSVFILIVTAKRKCSINDSIKGEYPFIKGLDENTECTLCNAKFCIARGVGRTSYV